MMKYNTPELPSLRPKRTDQDEALQYCTSAVCKVETQLTCSRSSPNKRHPHRIKFLEMVLQALSLFSCSPECNIKPARAPIGILMRKIERHERSVTNAPPTKPPSVVLNPHVAEIPPRYLPLSRGVVMSDVMIRTTGRAVSGRTMGSGQLAFREAHSASSLRGGKKSGESAYMTAGA